MVATAAKRAGRMADVATFAEAGDFLGQVLEPLAEGRLLGIPDSLALALQRVLATGGAVRMRLKPQRVRTMTARARLPGPPSTRSSKTPPAFSKSANSMSCGSRVILAAGPFCGWRR